MEKVKLILPFKLGYTILTATKIGIRYVNRWIGRKYDYLRVSV